MTCESQDICIGLMSGPVHYQHGSQCLTVSQQPLNPLSYISLICQFLLGVILSVWLLKLQTVPTARPQPPAGPAWPSDPPQYLSFLAQRGHCFQQFPQGKCFTQGTLLTCTSQHVLSMSDLLQNTDDRKSENYS